MLRVLSSWAVAAIVIGASLCSFLLGLAVLAGYQVRKARQRAEAEVAFQAALQDSGLGLDDVCDQVGFPIVTVGPVGLRSHFVLCPVSVSRCRCTAVARHGSHHSSYILSFTSHAFSCPLCSYSCNSPQDCCMHAFQQSSRGALLGCLITHLWLYSCNQS